MPEKYTKAELQSAVRLEKMQLVQEKTGLTRRLVEIENRLMELEKAEHLLEGE